MPHDANGEAKVSVDKGPSGDSKSRESKESAESKHGSKASDDDDGVETLREAALRSLRPDVGPAKGQPASGSPGSKAATAGATSGDGGTASSRAPPDHAAAAAATATAEAKADTASPHRPKGDSPATGAASARKQRSASVGPGGKGKGKGKAGIGGGSKSNGGGKTNGTATPPVCYMCCAPGHTALITHPNGDKEPTCRVVFKYEWGEFATHEVVSDESGAGLPAAWVNWFAVNKARGVDPRLMLCMLAMHRYRPRFLVEQFGTVAAALARVRKASGRQDAASAKAKRRGTPSTARSSNGSGNGNPRVRGRDASRSSVRGTKARARSSGRAGGVMAALHSPIKHSRRPATSAGLARGGAAVVGRDTDRRRSSARTPRAQSSRHQGHNTTLFYSTVGDSTSYPAGPLVGSPKGGEYRLGVAATLRVAPSGSHRKSKSASAAAGALSSSLPAAQRTPHGVVAGNGGTLPTAAQALAAVVPAGGYPVVVAGSAGWA